MHDIPQESMIRCRLFGSNPNIVHFRPSPLHLIFVLVFVLLLYNWILLQFEKVHERQIKPIDDILDWNNTKSHGSDNYHLFRRFKVASHYGDFSCNSSVRWRKCAFQITHITQATKFCDRFDQACIAFVLKSENGRLIAYLKNSVLRLKTDKNSALFVKKSFLPKLEIVRNLLRESI